MMNDKKVISMHLEVGNDNGNSEHDLVINGELIEQPNVISKVRKLPMLEEVNPDYVAKNIHDNLLTSINSPSVAPGIYFSGNYALRSGERVRSIEVGVDSNKADSNIVVINTLAHLSGFAIKKAFMQGEDLKNIEIALTIYMTTALPIKQYNKRVAEEFTKRFTEGKHNVTVYVGDISVNVYIVFEFVKVIPEGVTSIFALQSRQIIDKPEDELSDDEKKYNQEIKELFGEFVDGKSFLKKKVLHVAIGEGTTEYPLTKDIAFDPNFIFGSNNGIGHAIDKALPEFKEEIGLLNYSRQNYSEVLRNPGHKYYHLAMDIVEQYIEEESEEILQNVKREIQRANNEVDIVCVYGGGSILMREYLEKKLAQVCGRADIKLLYIPEKYAVTIEAVGMYEFVKGPIFKKLKEKYANINN